MRIGVNGFAGAVVAPNPKLLADGVGVVSLNQKPGRGDLRPWRQPLNVATVPADTRTIYRMGRDVASDSLYWLSWSTVVHAIHGFISGDATERTYYTGDGAPKQTNNTIALAAPPYPTAYRDLGVPVPVSAPLLVPLAEGVADETEIRYYVYTYVTDQGEESAPSPVSLEVSCKTDATFTIENLDAPPAGEHGINRLRVYRTQTGTAGDAEYFFLREELATIGTTTDDGRSLGEVMPTDGWLPPPATLSYLTAMWNGMAAAINTVDGAVRYCVAYKVYAWPIAYETLPPNAKAVALGVFGQNLLVLTTGRPVLVSGSSPDSLDEQPLPMAQSCVAPLSAVGLGHGVAWACPDGLAYVGESGAKLLTTGLITRDQWQAMNPASMTGAIYEGAYFGTYEVDGARRGFLIDPLNPTGIYFLDVGYEAMFFDESQDALFVLDGTAIKKWDAGTAMMTATFRSKVFTGTARNFAGARVEADAFPVTVVFDALDLAPDVVAERTAERPDLFTAPDATTLRHTRVVADAEPFRLPSGFEARNHQVEVETTSSVQWVAMASSMAELAEG